jgi:predicted lysophospholipase L1 biosynthesis ABC-type transport system permease subunit
MTGTDRFRRYLRSLLDRVGVDQEVDEELAFHIEMRTRDLMAKGMDERQAREAAIARFGDLAGVRRRCRRIAHGRERDLLLFVWMQQLRQDVIFAALALLIAVIGIYGVFSYRVARRRRDVGIRLAMGAQRRSVIQMILTQGLRLVALGVALGVLGALGLSRFLTSVLYETSPTDPLTFTAVIGVFTAVAVAACYLPARRAAQVDPSVALRAE